MLEFWAECPSALQTVPACSPGLHATPPRKRNAGSNLVLKRGTHLVERRPDKAATVHRRQEQLPAQGHHATAENTTLR